MRILKERSNQPALIVLIADSPGSAVPNSDLFFESFGAGQGDKAGKRFTGNHLETPVIAVVDNGFDVGDGRSVSPGQLGTDGVT